MRLLLFCALVLVACSEESGPRVVVREGELLGVRKGSVDAFRGIPFAEPPLKELRFAPPVPKAPWAPATWNATAYKHNCLQAGTFAKGPPGTHAEDCLYLNVFTPANRSETTALLPEP